MSDAATAPGASPGVDPFPALSTERLRLRRLRPSDAETLHRLINDWAVVRGLESLPFPYPRELADEWIASTHRQMAEERAWHLAIECATEDKGLLGAVGLKLDPAARSVDLGYWVGRPHWGKGIAAEAAGRLARWAMANLDVDRVAATCAADNPASAAVLRRIGFRDDGGGTSRFLARGGEHPVLRFVADRESLFGDFGDAPRPAAPVPVPAPAPATDASAAKPILLVAACALVDVDGRVLLSRRPEGRSMAGLWEFPGGKIEPGETPESALIRELREELGINVSQSCLAAFAFASHGYDRFHLLMPLYVCRRWSGTPTAREGQTLAWVRAEKLTEYRMPPADLPLVPLLRDLL